MKSRLIALAIALWLVLLTVVPALADTIITAAAGCRSGPGC